MSEPQAPYWPIDVDKVNRDFGLHHDAGDLDADVVRRFLLDAAEHIVYYRFAIEQAAAKIAVVEAAIPDLQRYYETHGRHDARVLDRVRTALAGTQAAPAETPVPPVCLCKVHDECRDCTDDCPCYPAATCPIVRGWTPEMCYLRDGHPGAHYFESDHAPQRPAAPVQNPEAAEGPTPVQITMLTNVINGSCAYSEDEITAAWAGVVDHYGSEWLADCIDDLIGYLRGHRSALILSAKPSAPLTPEAPAVTHARQHCGHYTENVGRDQCCLCGHVIHECDDTPCSGQTPTGGN